MASLLKCPPELVDSILEYLSVTDQWAVTLTSKRLRDIGTHTLYKHVKLGPKSQGDEHRVNLLLRSVLENRQLGGLVQTLEAYRYKSVDFPYEHMPTPTLPLTNLDLDTITDLIRESQVPHAKRWEDEAKAGQMDAIFTLLLSLLPNLRKLHTHGDFAIDYRILGQTLIYDLQMKPGGRLPMLRSLQDVSATPNHSGSGWSKTEDEKNTKEALAFFYLPGIHKITLEIDTPENTLAWPLSHQPNPSHLHTLFTCLIPGPGARAVFSVCNQLKRLVWNIWLPNRADLAHISAVFDVEDINTSLEPLRETVADLNLRVSYDELGGDHTIPFSSIQGSLNLAGFEHVHEFSVSWALIMGFRPGEVDFNRMRTSMPRNVEILDLSDSLCESRDWEWEAHDMLEALEEYMEHYMQEYTPDLLSIELLIFRERMQNEWPRFMASEMELMGGSYGVNIEVNTGYGNDLYDESSDTESFYGEVYEDDEIMDMDLLEDILSGRLPSSSTF